MVDKIKPLKIESGPGGGTETDPFPTEADPAEDYVSVKGVAFEGLDAFLIEKLGRVLVEKYPSIYHQINYSGSNVSSIVFYNSISFITANRIAQHDMTYTSNNLTTEALKIYDTDGSTILRTYTWTHSYSGSNLQSSGLVIT